MVGTATLGGSQALPEIDAPDAGEITHEQVSGLAEMLRFPAGHNQRFVEKLSFVPTGGLRCERNLQILLPSDDFSVGRWWILPLGPFNRLRFPDMVALDAAGNPLNLLPRKLHGLALSKATLVERFRALPLATRQLLQGPDAEPACDELYAQLEEYFTEKVEEPVDALSVEQFLARAREPGHPRIEKARKIVDEYGQLLERVDTPEKERRDSVSSFRSAIVEALDSTHYLCWLYARPGEVVNVRVSYTVRDPRHSMERDRVRSAFKAMLVGLTGVRIVPDFIGSKWEGFKKGKLREEAADWYRRFGLAPINYEFNIPTFKHATSYYATLTPPANADVTYHDWGQSNSYAVGKRGFSEVSSSSPCVHVYNADESQSEGGSRSSIRAYLRCTPYHHKQILGAALLNLALVWLLGEGRLPGGPGDPLKGVLLAAPAVLIAFLAQQQRHYYEHALRPSRGILWGYLVVGGLFLVAVAFSGQDLANGGPGLGTRASLAAGLLAVSSVAIFIWHFPLGHMYESIVYRRFRYRGRWKGWLRRNVFRKPGREGEKEDWKRYEEAYEECAAWIWRLVVIGAVITAAFMWLVWDPPQGAPAVHPESRAKLVLATSHRQRDAAPAAPRPSGSGPDETVLEPRGQGAPSSAQSRGVRG